MIKEVKGKSNNVVLIGRRRVRIEKLNCPDDDQEQIKMTTTQSNEDNYFEKVDIMYSICQECRKRSVEFSRRRVSTGGRTVVMVVMFVRTLVVMIGFS